ncbi:MAG: acetyl ornithine aminotransferase family protein [Acidobacteriota bacterium]
MTEFPKLPKLVTELPGPRAKEVIKRDNEFVSTSYTRGYPLVAEEGQGAVVKDVDGNYFLDFAAGIAVMVTGHSHPKIVEAIRDQAGKLVHMSGTDFYYSQQVKAAEALVKHMPGKDPKRVFFGNSGAEANECAIKLAKYHTGRKRFIAFHGAFHGRTTGALALTASKAVQKEKFFPLMEGVTHIPYPDPYRPYGPASGKGAFDPLVYLEETVFRTIVPPSEVAAVFVEPIQGEGGYVVPPAEFFHGLRRLCDKYGILLVDDEVQAGMGRTGKFLAIEHYGVQADITSLAKGIASGLPLSACIASSEVMNWPPGSHASTFGGNAVACRASIATLELLDGGLMDNAAEQGEFLIDSLREMMGKYDPIGDVRGKGLMIGVEFVKDRATKERAPELRDEVVRQCFKRGLLVLGCGPNTLRISPPLVIDREQARAFLDIFEESLQKAVKKLGYKGFPF